MALLSPSSISTPTLHNSDTSKALALLRWPLALCIIAVHWFCNEAFNVPSQQFHAFGFTKHFISSFITINGVGSFFFISGYLFFDFGSLTKERYIEKIKRRIFSLLIPYIIWNVLYYVIHAIYAYDSFSSVSFLSFVRSLFFSEMPPDYPLWFIRELMTCVILVPLLYQLMLKYPIILQSALFISICLISTLSNSIYLLRISESILFFSLGGILRLKSISLKKITHGKGRLSFVLFIIFNILYWICCDYNFTGAFIFKLISVFLLLCCIINLAYRLVEKGLQANVFLTSSTFFIFASHAFINNIWCSISLKIFNPTSDFQWVIISLIGYILLVMLLLAIYKIMATLLPYPTMILTGKRSKSSKKVIAAQ